MDSSYTLEIDATLNGRAGRAMVTVLDLNGKVLGTDKGDLSDGKELTKVANRVSTLLHKAGLSAVQSEVQERLETKWAETVSIWRSLKAERQERAKEQALPPPTNAPWREVDLPRGYTITNSGCVRELRDTDNVVTHGAVWVEAFAREHDSGSWSALLVWIDRDGKLHQQAFPVSRFHEQGVSLVQELADGGLAVVHGLERALLRYLAAFETQRRFRSVRRIGWVEGMPNDAQPVYVLPQEVIGAGEEEQFIFQPDGYLASAVTICQAGKLEPWQEQVAEYTRRNPVMIFALAASFVGPLLRFAGIDGGGFHFYGLSSRGKTTLLQLAGSVWGCGADPAEAAGKAFVRKWNATLNAIEALAAAHNDNLLAMDEIGEAQVRDFGRLVYNATSGQGRSRLTRDAMLREARAWRALMLSTGETPVRSVIESDGGTARGGQMNRIIDVPSAAEDGELVHDPHGETPADFVNRLKRACASYYGVAGPAFVRWLTEQGNIAYLTDAVQRALAESSTKICPTGVAEEVARGARRFALVDVAGRMAVEAGVLPHLSDEIRSAVVLVMQRWMGSSGKGGELGRAVARLRDFILRNEARFRNKSLDTAVVRDLAGYRDPDRNLYLMTPAGMREALAGHPVREVARFLDKMGWLEKNQKDRLTFKCRVAGIGKSFDVYAVRGDFLEHVSEDGVEPPRTPGTPRTHDESGELLMGCDVHG